MMSSVIGGAMLPHAPQFFTLPETEDKNVVEHDFLVDRDATAGDVRENFAVTLDTVDLGHAAQALSGEVAQELMDGWSPWPRRAPHRSADVLDSTGLAREVNTIHIFNNIGQVTHR